MKRACALVVLAAIARAGPAAAGEPGPSDPAATTPSAGEPAVPAASAPAAAAVPVASRLIVGADAVFQRPVGTLDDATGPGIGLLLRGEYNLMPRLNGTMRVGYVYSGQRAFDPGPEGVGVYLSKDNVPIWLGGKYFVTQQLYGFVEAGLDVILSKAETRIYPDSFSDSSTDVKAGASVGAGAFAGPLDLKVQFEILDLGHASDSMAILVGVGWNFWRS